MAGEKIRVVLDRVDILRYQDLRLLKAFENAFNLYEENCSQLTYMRLALIRLAKLPQTQTDVLSLMTSSRHNIDFELAALQPLNEAKKYYVKMKDLGQAGTVLQHQALLNK